MILIIPTTNTPESFSISLSGTTYILVVRWNAADEAGWIVDFYDQDNNPIVMNVALVTGTNLLGQYSYLGIPGLLYVTTDGDDYAVPTIDNLGYGADLLYESADPI